MASVGTFNFVIVPEPSAAAEEVQPLDRTGLSGVALRFFGFKGRPFTLECGVDLTLANGAAIDAQRDAYMDLVGTFQTIVCDNGATLLNVAIMGVEARFKKITPGVGGLVGAAGTHWATVRFECVDTNAA